MFASVDSTLSIPLADPESIPPAVSKAIPLLSYKECSLLVPRVFAVATGIGYYLPPTVGLKAAADGFDDSSALRAGHSLLSAHPRCIVVGFQGILITDCGADEELRFRGADERGRHHVHHIFSFSDVDGEYPSPVEPLGRIVVVANDPNWLLILPRASGARTGGALLHLVSHKDTQRMHVALWSLLQYHCSGRGASPSGSPAGEPLPVFQVVATVEELKRLAAPLGDTAVGLAAPCNDGEGKCNGEAVVCGQILSMQLASAVNCMVPFVVDPLQYAKAQLEAVEKQAAASGMEVVFNTVTRDIDSQEEVIDQTLRRIMQRANDAALGKKQLEELQLQLATIDSKLAATRIESAAIVAERASTIEGWNRILQTNTMKELEVERRLSSLREELGKRLQENKDGLVQLMEEEAALLSTLASVEEDTQEVAELQQRRMDLVDLVDKLAERLNKQMQEAVLPDVASGELHSSRSPPAKNSHGRAATGNQVLSPSISSSVSHWVPMHAGPRAAAVASQLSHQPARISSARSVLHQPCARAQPQMQRVGGDGADSKSTEQLRSAIPTPSRHRDPRITCASRTAETPNCGTTGASRGHPSPSVAATNEVCEDILALRKLRESLLKELRDEELLQSEVAVDAHSFRVEVKKLEEQKLLFSVERDMLRKVTETLEQQIDLLQDEMAAMSRELNQRRERLPKRYYVQKAFTQRALGGQQSTVALLQRLKLQTGNQMVALQHDLLSKTLRSANVGTGELPQLRSKLDEGQSLPPPR